MADEYDEMLSAARYKAERDVALQELEKVKAKLEERTCRNLADSDWEFKCSECGFWYDDTEFRYCPDCGAKVVKE